MPNESLNAILEAEFHTEETRSFVKQVRRITRRKFTYYAWLRDFMEAGKERLTRDTVRDATRAEVDGVKRENERRED